MRKIKRSTPDRKYPTQIYNKKHIKYAMRENFRVIYYKEIHINQLLAEHCCHVTRALQHQAPSIGTKLNI